MADEQSVIEVLQALDQVLARLEPVAVEREAAAAWRARLEAGQPALNEAEFPLTEAALFLAEIIRLRTGQQLAKTAARRLVEHYLADDSAGTLWQHYAIATQLGEAWAHLACQTALARSAAAVALAIPLDDWQRRECPVCGTIPSFASIEGSEGQRKLVCGSCLTHWRYKRIGCAFCGEEQPHRLKVLTAEEFPGWYAAVCLTCQGYIKTADLRQMAVRPRWQQAALTTLPLDYAAVNWLENFRLEQTVR